MDAPYDNLETIPDRSTIQPESPAIAPMPEYHYTPKRRTIPRLLIGVILALSAGTFVYIKNQPTQTVHNPAITPVKIEKPAQTFSDASLSVLPNTGGSTISGKRAPTAIPTYTAPTPHTIVEYGQTTASPTRLPTAAPTMSKPVADYFSDGIKVIGAANNSTILEEDSSLSTMKIEGNFRNNAMIESSRKISVKVYYDGIYKTTLERAEYGAYSATFTYVPPVDPGSHTVRMVINENRTITETNYGNNEQTITYTIIPDTTPPGFTLDGPYQINNQTCMRWINLSDNVSVYTDVWAKWKIDEGSWSAPTSENPYGCISATSGTTHTYTVHAEDRRANVTEQSKTFVAF